MYQTLLMLFFFLLDVFCRSFPALNRGLLLSKPPIDIDGHGGRGGGGEYGIRQLTAEECQRALVSWRKSQGMVRGDSGIEQFELMEMLDKVSKIMPGKYPHRNEFLCFAELVDGTIECMSAMYCGKVTCPWELEVIAIAHAPSLSSRNDVNERTQSMVDFINQLCKDNAILPNYLPLSQFPTVKFILPQSLSVPNYSAVSSINSKSAGIADPMPDKFWNPGSLSASSSSATSSSSTSSTSASSSSLSNDSPLHLLDVIVRQYVDANRARPHYICLDNIPQVILGPYWFRLLVSNPHLEENDQRNIHVPVYFRQKLSGVVRHKAAVEDGNETLDAASCNEFEILFSRPATGTECGSGTVGGALILSEERAQEMLPQVSPAYFESVRRAMSAKILHPDLRELEWPPQKGTSANDKTTFSAPPRHV